MKSTREGHCVTLLALFLFLRTFPLFCGGSGEAAAAMVVSGACSGRSVGECLLERGMGAEMGSEASRRSLQQSQNQKYISYRFLSRDTVPCTTPGVPYYSCHALPSSNPHTRGCLTITRCARDSYP